MKKLLLSLSAIFIVACNSNEQNINGNMNLSKGQKGQIGEYQVTNIGKEDISINTKITNNKSLELILLDKEDGDVKVMNEFGQLVVDLDKDRVEVVTIESKGMNFNVTNGEYGQVHPSANPPQVSEWKSPVGGTFEVEWNIWYGVKADKYAILLNGLEIYRSNQLVKPSFEGVQNEKYLLTNLASGTHKLQVILLYEEDGVVYHTKSNEFTKVIDNPDESVDGGDTGNGDTGSETGGDTSGNLGSSRILTDAEISAEWEGIDPLYIPTAVNTTISSLITFDMYEEFFPRKFGSPGWEEISGKPDTPEYYTYDNFVNALVDISSIKLKIYTKNYAVKVVRLDKITKEEKVIRVDGDYNADWLKNVEPLVQIVDYGKFLKEGTDEIRKRELAAFLANISHETTGGWDTAPGGRYAWGLYFNEEVNYNKDSVGGYTQSDNVIYPPNPTESYHGRGPIQLSWNYNYGYMSEVIYGDKNILLNNPDAVAEDGKLGFMTAIWFWMTPQEPKPSCHDVMAGNWIPDAEDISANRLPGFGVTINVINGGLEAGIPNDYRVKDRIGFFEVFTGKLGVTMGENVDCYNQKPF